MFNVIVVANRSQAFLTVRDGKIAFTSDVNCTYRFASEKSARETMCQIFSPVPNYQIVAAN